MLSVTTIFEEDETIAFDGQAYNNGDGHQVDPHRATFGGGKTNSQEIVAAHEYLKKLRVQQENGLSLKQKLDLVMQRSTHAEQLASSVSERLDDLSLAVSKISHTLDRMAGPSQDPPGSSIFDEDVLEWDASQKCSIR